MRNFLFMKIRQFNWRSIPIIMPTKTNSSHFAPQSCDKSNFWHFTNKIRLKRRKKSTGTIFKEFKLFVCFFYCISKYIYSLFVSCILK